jgi:hypothetical protein
MAYKDLQKISPPPSITKKNRSIRITIMNLQAYKLLVQPGSSNGSVRKIASRQPITSQNNQKTQKNGTSKSELTYGRCYTRITTYDEGIYRKNGCNV